MISGLYLLCDGKAVLARSTRDGCQQIVKLLCNGDLLSELQRRGFIFHCRGEIVISFWSGLDKMREVVHTVDWFTDREVGAGYSQAWIADVAETGEGRLQ